MIVIILSMNDTGHKGVAHGDYVILCNLTVFIPNRPNGGLDRWTIFSLVSRGENMGREMKNTNFVRVVSETQCTDKIKQTLRDNYQHGLSRHQWKPERKHWSERSPRESKCKEREKGNHPSKPVTPPPLMYSTSRLEGISPS